MLEYISKYYKMESIADKGEKNRKKYSFKIIYEIHGLIYGLEKSVKPNERSATNHIISVGGCPRDLRKWRTFISSKRNQYWFKRCNNKAKEVEKNIRFKELIL